MNANEPGYDELCMRTEGHGDEMPLTDGDGFWDSFDALLDHADEVHLNRMIGRIKTHVRKIVDAHDNEGRRIDALRRLIGDPMPAAPKTAAPRARRSDAGRPRSTKPAAVASEPETDTDPFDPILVGYEEEAS